MELNIKENKTVRYKKFLRIYNKFIKNYIENESKSYGLTIAVPLVTKLPKKLIHVGGYLDIENSMINDLSNLEIVRGDLYLSNYVTKLPDTLKYIDGDLVANQSKLEYIPDNLVIKGDCYIFGTPLARKYSKNKLKEKININGELFNTHFSYKFRTINDLIKHVISDKILLQKIWFLFLILCVCIRLAYFLLKEILIPLFN